MASRIRGSLKMLGFCVGTVGTAVGTTVFCVGTVGTGGKGYIEYLPLSGPYGPYAKSSGPYSGPYGPYKLPIDLFMSVYRCTWVPRQNQLPMLGYFQCTAKQSGCQLSALFGHDKAAARQLIEKNAVRSHVCHDIRRYISVC